MVSEPERGVVLFGMVCERGLCKKKNQFVFGRFAETD